MATDVNECSSSSFNNCHRHADCHNSERSFHCNCQSGFRNLQSRLIERFSNECRKTKTKVITPANHNKHKLPNEPIRTRSNYM